MSRIELFPIGLNTFNVVSLRADPPNDSEPGVSYRVGILRHGDHLRLVGIVTVMGENARGLVVMDGDAMWRESDFETPLLELDDEELSKIVAKSFAIHTLYDAAAMTLRQSFGLLGSEQPVQQLTPEPEIDFIPISTDESAETSS